MVSERMQGSKHNITDTLFSCPHILPHSPTGTHSHDLSLSLRSLVVGGSVRVGVIGSLVMSYFRCFGVRDGGFGLRLKLKLKLSGGRGKGGS